MKRFIIGLSCFICVAFNTKVCAHISVDENWTHQNGERFGTLSLNLVKEGNRLVILSDRLLENLSIAVANEDGSDVYWQMEHIVVDREYFIPLDMFPVGNYRVTIMQEKNYLIRYFHID